MRAAISEIYQFRELLLTLAYRDIRIRYKQTLLGAAWAVFNPIVMMVIFSQVFSRVARIDTGDIPYPIFVYCGLLPWQLFSNTLKGAVESLTRNSRLVSKIYMPREVFPLSQIVASLVDFAIASVVLVAMMAWYGYWPKATCVLLPMILLVQILFMTGLSLFLAMANLFYRDVKFIFEVVLLLWMFVTSVVYPIPSGGAWGWLLALNPMTPIIDGYRNVLLLGQWPDPLGFAYATILSLVLCVIALRWFHETEYLFAEVI